MMFMVAKAKSIREAWQACDPQKPLPGRDDPNYVDLREARGGQGAIESLLLGVRWAGDGEFVRQLLIGHPGSGKTTELHGLSQILEREDIFTVIVDVEQFLSLDDVGYADVLLVAAERLLSQAMDQLGLHLDGHEVKEMRRSLLVGTEVTQREKKADISLKGDLKILAGELKLSALKRKEFRDNIEKDQASFLGALNSLLEKSRAQLNSHGRRDLVIIIDGLEKMRYRKLDDFHDTYEDLFVRRSELFSQVRCHQIMTVPVVVSYEYNLQQLYTACERLPMVALADHRGTKRDTGIAGMRRVVEARVDLDRVFETSDDILELIDFSGGHVRDLLRLVRYACQIAGEDEMISRPAIEGACHRLIREYDSLISSEDIGPLVELHHTRMLKSDPSYVKLLRKLLALEYSNQHRWGAVHPAAVNGLVVQRALAERD
jgi:energy-coupling factor transporter ATP-binding protein EcfA2